MGRRLAPIAGRSWHRAAAPAIALAACLALLACGATSAARYPTGSAGRFMRGCGRVAALASCACIVRGMESAGRPADDLGVAEAVLAGRSAAPSWFAKAAGGC